MKRSVVRASAKAPDTVESGCLGKQPFADPDFAARIARKQHSNGRKLSVYRCKWCRKFHIGSNES